ncbi:MAG: hypothetical protein JJ902_11405 [Roseibium sp.]|nr:hypothetical protein [Roseibium sp.]
MGGETADILTEHWFGVEEFRIKSCWDLCVPEQHVRTILNDPMSILDWWPAVFMHGEVLEQPDDTLVGFTARFHTKGFLPHTFQFVASIVELTASGIVIKTTGDFDGMGTILISECNGKSKVTVEWRVWVKHPYIQPFLRILKPVFVWNHLWAMRQGRKGLESLLLGGGGRWQRAQQPTFPHNLAALRIPSKWRL